MDDIEPVDYPGDLSEATTIYSHLILTSSRDLGKPLIDAFTQEGGVLTDPLRAIAGLPLEGCYFFLHITDRHAFVRLGDQGRAGLVESVEIRTIGLAALWLKMIMDDPERTDAEKETLGQLASGAGESYAAATQEYARYKAAVPGKAPLAETILGHYVRRSVDLLGMESVSAAVSMAMTAMAVLKFLNPEGLIDVWEKSQEPRNRAA